MPINPPETSSSPSQEGNDQKSEPLPSLFPGLPLEIITIILSQLEIADLVNFLAVNKVLKATIVGKLDVISEFGKKLLIKDLDTYNDLKNLIANNCSFKEAVILVLRELSLKFPNLYSNKINAFIREQSEKPLFFLKIFMALECFNIQIDETLEPIVSDDFTQELNNCIDHLVDAKVNKNDKNLKQEKIKFSGLCLGEFSRYFDYSISSDIKDFHLAMFRACPYLLVPFLKYSFNQLCENDTARFKLLATLEPAKLNFLTAAQSELKLQPDLTVGDCLKLLTFVRNIAKERDSADQSDTSDNTAKILAAILVVPSALTLLALFMEFSATIFSNGFARDTPFWVRESALIFFSIINLCLFQGLADNYVFGEILSGKIKILNQDRALELKGILRIKNLFNFILKSTQFHSTEKPKVEDLLKHPNVREYFAEAFASTYRFRKLILLSVPVFLTMMLLFLVSWIDKVASWLDKPGISDFLESVSNDDSPAISNKISVGLIGSIICLYSFMCLPGERGLDKCSKQLLDEPDAEPGQGVVVNISEYAPEETSELKSPDKTSFLAGWSRFFPRNTVPATVPLLSEQHTNPCSLRTKSSRESEGSTYKISTSALKH